MPKNKFYVVWKGKEPGIYRSWPDCKAQIDGINGALYMGFPTSELAEKAFGDAPWKYIGNKQNIAVKASASNSLHGIPISDSICVDAACSGNPGVLEYRGVDTKSGAELFHIGPFPEGTVNLGEFLGIVHALAYLKQRDSDWPVYTDSVTAMAWVRNKAIKTNLVRTQKNAGLFELVDRALKWIRENQWPNRIVKWKTEVWGEIPADFGRK
jgi:ribonuclease HI